MKWILLLALIGTTIFCYSQESKIKKKVIPLVEQKKFDEAIVELNDLRPKNKEKAILNNWYFNIYKGKLYYSRL